jgi:hypothetical protein
MGMPTHWNVDGLDATTGQASLIMWNSANQALNSWCRWH